MTFLPAAPPEKQKAVERLVNRILAAKQRDAKADTSAWEREVASQPRRVLPRKTMAAIATGGDVLVYALYGLTPEKKPSSKPPRNECPHPERRCGTCLAEAPAGMEEKFQRQRADQISPMGSVCRSWRQVEVRGEPRCQVPSARRYAKRPGAGCITLSPPFFASG